MCVGEQSLFKIFVFQLLFTIGEFYIVISDSQLSLENRAVKYLLNLFVRLFANKGPSTQSYGFSSSRVDVRVGP